MKSFFEDRKLRNPVIEFRAPYLGLAGLLAVLFIPHALADFRIHHWELFQTEPRAIRLVPELGYSTTESNYGAAGKSLAPSGLEKYERFFLDLQGTYGVWEDFSLFARLSWANVHYALARRSASTFGFQDQSAGLSWSAYRPKTWLLVALQAQVDFPLYRNRNALSNQTPYLGDGTKDLTGGAFVEARGLHFGSYSLTGTMGAGYTWRTDDFSSAIPWTVSANLSPMALGITGKLSVFGVQSLRTDPHTTSGGANTRSTEGSGGSFATNTANPSHVIVAARAGFQLGPSFEVHGGAERTVWGLNTAEAWTFRGGLTLVLGLPRTERAPELQNSQEYGRANRGFVSYGVEAKVTRVNDRLNLVKLDKGSDDGIQVGQTMDIFSVKKDGTVNEAIARGTVTAVRSGEAAVKITEYFREVWIEEGFVVKRPLD